ncbi:MAG: CDP-alcohol phosphatidyltransferase family protein [Phycisphaerae bacterium]
MSREKLLTWPNRLTMLRIILVGPFVVALLNLHSTEWYWPWSRYFAVVIFLMTILSDGLDGYLARRWHQETPLGKFLDPVADKLLITCGVILLGIENMCAHGAFEVCFKFPNWVVVAAIGKDLFVTIGFLLIFIVSGKIFINPTWSGKTTTITQMVMILITLLAPDIVSMGDYGAKLALYLTRALWAVTAAMALVTCWDYFRRGMRFVYQQQTVEGKQ